MPEPVGRAELKAIHGFGRAWQVCKPGPNENVERVCSRRDMRSFVLAEHAPPPAAVLDL